MRPANVRALAYGIAVILIAVAAFISHTLTMQSGLERLREAARSRLDMLVTEMDGRLARYDYLPSLLEMSPDVFRLLQTPSDPVARDQVNRYLHSINAAAGATNLYILDSNGIGLAAADWNQPGTPVGASFAFRPYMQDALSKGHGRFYGVGVTSGRAGYYLSFALYKGGNQRGVATVKANLEDTARAWNKLPGSVLLTDSNDVVILSSRTEWQFKPLAPLTANVRAEIAKTRPYGSADLQALNWQLKEKLSDDAQIISLDGTLYLASTRNMKQTGWRLIVLDEMAPVQDGARSLAVMAALASAVLLLLGTVFWLRQRVLHQKLASRAALQTAHDSLESRVAERTEELRHTNQLLGKEVDTRKAIEADLRATQNDLIHAGQLAAFGQMSAGIVHELNQPLGALRTLSDNACVLLEQQRGDDARTNMQRIAQIVDRLGRLIYQLKNFAYKSNTSHEPVVLQQVINSALFIVSQRLRDHGIEMQMQIPPDELTVLADEARLEQVIVNLIGNAIDAMETSPVRCLRIDIQQRDERCFVAISDTGSGIREDILPRLFEPFTTTKPAGTGLGLGLVISAQIVSEFGGHLSAHNLDTGGACFQLELPTYSLKETGHV